MHRDVMALVDGGYTADEIIEAFENANGERVLMAPKREGFNLLAYVLPGTAIAAGAVVLAVMLRRWRRAPRGTVEPSSSVDESSPQAVSNRVAASEAATRRVAERKRMALLGLGQPYLSHVPALGQQ